MRVDFNGLLSFSSFSSLPPTPVSLSLPLCLTEAKLFFCTILFYQTRFIFLDILTSYTHAKRKEIGQRRRI